jgi:glycosyltransferase involved in cell wall biosynthesis
VPEKGYDVMLATVARLPGCRAVIVGGGPEQATLERLTRQLEIDDRVTITGFVPSARAYLPRFDVFMLTSWSEGLPVSIVEAMLAELPVVTTDVGGVREAVLDGVTGFVVGRGDVTSLAASVDTLIGDEELRRQMGGAGRARALELFSLERAAEQYIAMYRHARRGGGRASRARPCPPS